MPASPGDPLPPEPLPGERPHAADGRADPAKLAEFERRVFPQLRRTLGAATPLDDELPADPIANAAEARRVIAKHRRLL